MLADFLSENYEKVLDRTVLFDKIYDSIASKTDWSITEFILLYGLVLDYKPNCILELGRGMGNSLYTISLALDDLDYAPKPAVSVSLEKKGVMRRVNSAVEKNTGYKLNPSIKIMAKNFLKWDYSILQQEDNILIFYDMHGAELMQHFIDKIIPLLKLKRHLVIFHDFSYELGLTQKDFAQRKETLPKELEDHYFVRCGDREAGGFNGFPEAPVLIEYIEQRQIKIGFPYSDLSLCLDKYYRQRLNKLKNYRKDCTTSLIVVHF